MKKTKYNFKQAELYTIAYFILEAVSSLLGRFTAFKGKYVAAWVADRIAQVDAAADEPDEDQRSATHEVLRVQLLALVQQSLIAFKAMERYIADVFPIDEQQINIDAAGGTQYADAANDDFDACELMLKNLSKFADDNEIQLLNGGLNMPAIYKTNLDLLKVSFKEVHLSFIGAEGGAEIGTDAKIDLNNAVYTEIISSINADAQVIFDSDADAAKRKQFVLEHQLFLVRGAGVAGMRVHVTDSADEQDIADVEIKVTPGDKAVNTDENGRALLLQLAAGNYTIAVAKTGYVTQEIAVAVETGTVKRVDVVLVKNP